MPGTDTESKFLLTTDAYAAFTSLQGSSGAWEAQELPWGVFLRGGDGLRELMDSVGIPYQVVPTGGVSFPRSGGEFSMATLPELPAGADPHVQRTWWVQSRFQAPPHFEVGKVFRIDAQTKVQVIGFVSHDVVTVRASATQIAVVLARFPTMIVAARPMPDAVKLVGSLSRLDDADEVAAVVHLYPDSVISLTPYLGKVRQEALKDGRVRVRTTMKRLRHLAARPEVARITRAGTPTLSSGGDGTSALAETLTSNPIVLDGAGETIVFADTGFDMGADAPLHPDFHPDRIDFVTLPLPASVRALVKDQPSTDPPDDASDKGPRGRAALPCDVKAGAGHGTHVVSRAIGSGAKAEALVGKAPAEIADQMIVVTESGRPIPRGVAPAASGVILALGVGVTWAGSDRPILFPKGGEYGIFALPDTLGDLITKTIDNNGSILNNSWNLGSTPGDYDAGAHSFDQLAWKHPDVLIVCSVGNREADAPKEDTGLPTSPATARNVLSVGMVAYSANDNKSPPVRVDDSRHGWADTGSRKPEVLAAGLGTWGARPNESAVATGSFGDKEISTTGKDKNLAPYYRQASGTSMAAPLISGFAAVLRQFYRLQNPSRSPSAALLRATITFYATPIDPANVTDADGFGYLPIERARAALASAPHFVIGDDSDAQIQQGTMHAHDVDVTSDAAPMRVVLAWTDPPEDGAGFTGKLQNDLRLVLVAPDGGETAAASTFGNLQRVDVTAPKVGRWTICVRAQVVARDGPRPTTDGIARAGYALVASHAANGARSLTPPEDTGPHGPSLLEPEPLEFTGRLLFQANPADAGASRLTKLVTATVLSPSQAPQCVPPFQAWWIGPIADAALDVAGSWLFPIGLGTPHPAQAPTKARGVALSVRAALPPDESTWATAAEREALRTGEERQLLAVPELLLAGAELVAWTVAEFKPVDGAILQFARVEVDVEPGATQLAAVFRWGCADAEPIATVQLREPGGKTWALGSATVTLDAGTGWCHLAKTSPTAGKWVLEAAVYPLAGLRRLHVVGFVTPPVERRLTLTIEAGNIVVRPGANDLGVTSVRAEVATLADATRGTTAFPPVIGDAARLPVVREVDLKDDGTGVWSALLGQTGACSVTATVRGTIDGNPWQRRLPWTGVQPL